jgi:predicted AAA+ superfamily ATPase
METLLFQYNPWWEGEYKSNLIRRDALITKLIGKLHSPSVVFITGLRRIGKTACMRLMIEHLINKKITDPTRILYISLDDYLLDKFSIQEILTEYRKIHKLRHNEQIYLFLDEITCKPSFEIELKNLYDKGNVKIYASSSSSSLMKQKKHLLTGRHIVIELLPLDFNEYLSFGNIKIKKADNHLLAAYFEQFLETGGIPEFVLKHEISYLHDLADDIICKDIAAVHGIRNIQQLKNYFLLLMERTGKMTSINKIASILKISPDTSRRYFDLFCETYLIHPVSRFGKTNERILSPKKIYAGDIGIRNIFTGFRDKGSLFENYVFLKIKHFDPYYIYENTTELDFYVRTKALIEVKYHDEDLSIKQRELYDSFSSPYKAIIRSESDIQDAIKHIG